MAGYTRQNDSDIQAGQAISAGPLKNEFDTLEAAFHGTTGHNHTGTTGNSPKIDLTTSVSDELPIANGGTNANSAAAARTNLGLAIGTDVQAYDGTLQALSGLTTSADKLIYATGSDTFATSNLTAFGRSIIDDTNASAARVTLGLGTAATANTGIAAGSDIPTRDNADSRYLQSSNNLSDVGSTSTARTNLGVAIGSNVQGYSARLGDIAGVTLVSGDAFYWNGTNVVKTATTSLGRTLLNSASTSDARTSLGLGSVSTLNTGVAAGEVRTNSQNDAVYQPLDSDLTALAGLTPAAEEMYARGSSGSLTTIPLKQFLQDAFSSTDAAAFRAAIGVSASGTALQVSSNLADLNNVVTARANLGLGSAAVLNQGTASGDLITKGYADSNYIGTGATLGITNGGTGAITAAAARTNLGLGTAATYNIGTSGSTLITVTNADERYLQETSNLSDLDNVTTARANLGLNSMATQSSSSVAITGGSISGVTISGTYSGLPVASTTISGIVQLDNTVSSTSTARAATANAVKTAYDLAAGKANSSHTHDAADIVSGTIASVRLPSASTTVSGIVQLNNTTSSTSTTQAATAATAKTLQDAINGKAATSHNHAWADIVSGIPSFASRWPTWSEVTSKPSTFTPSSHSHTAGDLPVLSAMSGAITDSQMPTNSNGRGVRTVSTGSPTGGNNGDIWLKV